MFWEVAADGRLVNHDDIICVGFCGRRGPNSSYLISRSPARGVKAVQSVDQVTCAACVRIHHDGYPPRGQ